jgi:hypothetical protein
MKKSVSKMVGFHLSLLALAMAIVAPPQVATAEPSPTFVPAENLQQYLTRPQILKGLRQTGDDGFWELVTSTDNETWIRSGVLQELMRFEILEPELESLGSKDASLGRFSLFGTLTPDDGGEARYVAGVLPSADAGTFRRFFPVLVSPDVTIAYDMASKMAEISNGGPVIELASPIPGDKSGAECVAACNAAYNGALTVCSITSAACASLVLANKDTCDAGCDAKPPAQQPACYNNCEDVEVAGLAVCAAAFTACTVNALSARNACRSGCHTGGPGGPPPV